MHFLKIEMEFSVNDSVSTLNWFQKFHKKILKIFMLIKRLNEGIEQSHPSLKQK